MAALIAGRGREDFGSPPATASGASAPSAVSEPAKRISKAHIEATLAKLADEQDEDYDWKRSIVSSCARRLFQKTAVIARNRSHRRAISRSAHSKT